MCILLLSFCVSNKGHRGKVGGATIDTVVASSKYGLDLDKTEIIMYSNEKNVPIKKRIHHEAKTHIVNSIIDNYLFRNG